MLYHPMIILQPFESSKLEQIEKRRKWKLIYVKDLQQAFEDLELIWSFS